MNFTPSDESFFQLPLQDEVFQLIFNSQSIDDLLSIHHSLPSSSSSSTSEEFSSVPSFVPIPFPTVYHSRNSYPPNFKPEDYFIHPYAKHIANALFNGKSNFSLSALRGRYKTNCSSQKQKCNDFDTVIDTLCSSQMFSIYWERGKQIAYNDPIEMCEIFQRQKLLYNIILYVEQRAPITCDIFWFVKQELDIAAEEFYPNLTSLELKFMLEFMKKPYFSLQILSHTCEKCKSSLLRKSATKFNKFVQKHDLIAHESL